jgi:hypothetical protein
MSLHSSWNQRRSAQIIGNPSATTQVDIRGLTQQPRLAISIDSVLTEECPVLTLTVWGS